MNATERRESVKQAYSRIAEQPHGEQPFPIGRDLAESLGYPSDLLAELPDASVAAFCGLSNVSLFAQIPEGATVLDVGCGSGVDTLIASRRAGTQGRVIALDFSLAMLTRARNAIAEAQATNVETHLADAEQLPIQDARVDVAIVNGLFNLNPCRERLFAELARVIKPHGAVYGAELALSSPATEAETDAANWLA